MAEYLVAGGIAGLVAKGVMLRCPKLLMKEKVGAVVGFPALGCFFYSRTVVPVTDFSKIDYPDLARRFAGGCLAGCLAAGISHGTLSTALRTMPFFGFQQVTYDAILIYYQLPHTPPMFLCSGLAAGAFAHLVTYPLETLATSRGTVAWQGVATSCAKVAPAVAVTLTMRDVCLGRAESLF